MWLRVAVQRSGQRAVESATASPKENTPVAPLRLSNSGLGLDAELRLATPRDASTVPATREIRARRTRQFEAFARPLDCARAHWPGSPEGCQERKNEGQASAFGSKLQPCEPKMTCAAILAHAEKK